MEKYELARKCTDCGFEVKAPLTKREAAFGLFDTEKLFGLTCLKCGGIKSSGSVDLPILNKELVSEWAQNEHLYFLSQDEELILGTGEYFELIIEVLDNPQTLLHKKYVLLYALCVIVFDETVERGKNWKPEVKLKCRAIKELNKRKNLLIEAGDSIMNYIKEVVYPQLEMGWRSKD